MKPAQIRAEKERRARAQFRKWARRIPDNAALANILLGFPEKPFRAEFYRRVVPLLNFKAIPLEAIDNV